MKKIVIANEIETTYVNEDDRFVVSLVLSVPASDTTRTSTDALGAALARIHLLERPDEHVWCVHDAETGERLLIRAGDTLERGSSGAKASERSEPGAAGHAERAEGAGAERRPPQLDLLAREEAVDLLEDLAWGDIPWSIDTIDRAMQLALEATSDDFARWENEDILGCIDEFSLTKQQVRDLSERWRLAYVARLLRTIAHEYGVNTELGNGVLGALHADPKRIGSIMRRLDAIVDRSIRRRPGFS